MHGEGLPTHCCEQKHVEILGGGFQVFPFHFFISFLGKHCPHLNNKLVERSGENTASPRRLVYVAAQLKDEI